MNSNPARSRTSGEWLLVVIAMCVAIALAFSIQWAIPMFSGGSPDTYVPVRYAPHSISDNYFYFTFVREIIDRGLSYGDPMTFEHSGVPAMHDTYKGSLAIVALGGIFTGRTEHAYVLAHVILPPLNFIFLYLLICRIVERRGISLLLAAICVFAYNQPLNIIKQLASFDGAFFRGFFTGSTDLMQLTSMSRVPNVLVTNLHLSMLVLSLHEVIEEAGRRKFWLFAVFALLSVSSYMSPQNFIMSYAFAGVSFLMLLDRKTTAIALAAAAVLSIVPNIYGIKVILTASEHMQTSVGYSSGSPYYVLDRFYWDRYMPFLIETVSATAVAVFFSSYKRKFVLGIGLAVVACYLGFAVLGSYTPVEIYVRGAQPVFVTVMLSAIIRALLDAPANEQSPLLGGRRSVKFLYRGLKAAGGWLNSALSRRRAELTCVALALLLVAGVIFNQIAVYKDKTRAFHDPEFTALSAWARANAGQGEVALTMDFDLVMHLPVYTPLNFYVPEAILSPASHEERYSRFAEAAAFYGMDASMIKGLLGSLISHYRIPELRDPNEIRLALMNLGLFYARFSLVPVDAQYKQWISGLFDALPSASRLSRRADYLIVSDFDRQLMRPGSRAYTYLETAPVYSNSRYSVYKLK